MKTDGLTRLTSDSSEITIVLFAPACSRPCIRSDFASRITGRRNGPPLADFVCRHGRREMKRPDRRDTRDRSRFPNVRSTRLRSGSLPGDTGCMGRTILGCLRHGRMPRRWTEKRCRLLRNLPRCLQTKAKCVWKSAIGETQSRIRAEVRSGS